ncbi:uncharacterized protein LOC117178804 [Belonocnema kinseyi]|uniref:uncharacterized protein LOC117178804 n=1 Tax=Belonocnema kinseyi TaxID=2817044 RepID=UPI00143D9C53|nr:uncharacterized protein LOC117178804 [Belonocnema kinseyi]
MEVAKWKPNQVMIRVSGWMAEHGPSLTIQKTEVVVLTAKRVDTIIPLQMGNQETVTKRAMKKATEKAANVTTALSRSMANVGGPKPSKRRLLMSVTTSILLYGAEIWADAFRIEKYSKRMADVQKLKALRVACSSRTVSEPTILVVARVIPIDLQTRKRNAQCDYGDAEKDDAYHTFFVCKRWTAHRQILEQQISNITPENIFKRMLTSAENWDRVAVHGETMLRHKKQEQSLNPP